MTDRVHQIVRKLFAESDRAQAITALWHYADNAFFDDIEGVQIAVLKLSEGELDKLQRYILAALSDYRDVLAWAHAPRRMEIGPPVPNARRRDIKEFDEWLAWALSDEDEGQ